MKSHKLLLGCGIVLALGLGIVAIGMIASYLIPGVDQQLPPSAFSLLANISIPLNDATLPLNQPASVYVQAWGDQPLQDIQLLVDNVPQSNGSSSLAGDKKMIVSWTWTPAEEGVHTLVARANAQSGLTRISSAVKVNALPLDQMPLPLAQGGAVEPLVINDEIGSTEQGAESESGIPVPPPFPDLGNAGNPPPLPTEPPGQEPAVEASQQPGDNLVPIKYLLWAEMLTKEFIIVNLPAAPKLDGGAKQCEAILVAQDNSSDEIGFFLYRLDPGQQAFSRVATLDGKVGKAAFSYHDPGLASGEYSYYLSAFNSGGESASNIISLTVDAPQCKAANKPKFDVKSIPIDPGQPVDKAYCYGSASGMPWVRLPYGQNSFIYPVDNKFDLGPYWDSIPLPQPMPPEVTLNMECWGWSGSVLVFLGSSSQTFSGGGESTPAPPPPPPRWRPGFDTGRTAQVESRQSLQCPY